ncbi:hypothetical protein D9M68_1000300 [compost metagenome]
MDYKTEALRIKLPTLKQLSYFWGHEPDMNKIIINHNYFIHQRLHLTNENIINI